eukprot:TRINITY_DN67238_c0_g1_i1.p1 TRINITY_DN67238_c0_g1~~TRINITY_DN67238_c0_g1_i1.p1  ORF type:complete len:630 (-),score=95.24 TRINITY_DN67238_c0_g1_i1:32-1921(-)
MVLTMELDGLDAQGFLRSTIGCMMVGDTVETDKGSGVVKSIHEDRTITVHLVGSAHRCLQRDCRILTPARVVIPREVQSRRISNALQWRGHVKVKYTGPLEKLVCSTSITLSKEASSIEIVRGVLQVDGQDQGWGNTGSAGLHLRFKYMHPDSTFDEFTVAKITYDHNRNRAGVHRLDFAVRLGLKSTSPIVVEAIVQTPSWGGWSASATKVQLDVEVVETCMVVDSAEAWSAARITESEAIGLLWRRCGTSVLQGREGDEVKDSSLGLEHGRLHLGWPGYLDVDMSHLSNSGLERQGIVGKAEVASLSDQKVQRGEVIARLVADLGCRSELSADQQRRITKMARVLEQAERVSNGPGEADDRRAACDELLAMISATLVELSRTRADMVEFVAATFAEAVQHCWTAWEESVHMAYHVVCPDASSPSNVMTLDVEDWLLGELHTLRRDLGYRALAKAKTAAGETDVHFKNFFFSTIHFGLPLLQRAAARDPSRLNYTALNLVNMDEIRAGIWRRYTPQALVAHVRGLLAAGAYWRGRVVDWLRVRCPRGLDLEQWLYEWCHDEDYNLRDEALVFMLASMRVLQGSTLSEVRPASAPSRTRAPAATSLQPMMARELREPSTDQAKCSCCVM